MPVLLVFYDFAVLLAISQAETRIAGKRSGPWSSPSVDKQAEGSAEQQSNATGLRNTCHAEP